MTDAPLETIFELPSSATAIALIAVSYTHLFSSQSIFKSLANVAESQLTYTILSGDIASIVSRHFSSQPFLGGDVYKRQL